MNKEAELPTISMMPDDTFYFDKVYYHVVHVLLQFNKQGGVDKRQ